MADIAHDPVTALRIGHDENAHIDIMVRTYASGAETVAFRGGKNDTTAGWSPEIIVAPINPPLSEPDPWVPVLP